MKLVIYLALELILGTVMWLFVDAFAPFWVVWVFYIAFGFFAIRPIWWLVTTVRPEVISVVDFRSYGKFLSSEVGLWLTGHTIILFAVMSSLITQVMPVYIVPIILLLIILVIANGKVVASIVHGWPLFPK